MSDRQNLAYAVVQTVHNFGAIAAVGSSLAAVSFRGVDTRRKLAWLALAGWGTQAISGAAFGAVSYYFYHQFPDIAGIATVALMIKMACVIAGFLLLAVYLLRSADWTVGKMNGAWLMSSSLAAIALTAAAFLRWFS
ncbi:MAG: hypothetical protein HY306_07605 [Nitrosomonadales bacterium]|nr:hypothetical protein [Nitrosomonadales bacterium]